MLFEAEAKELDTLECQELAKMAEELLIIAQECFRSGNYIAANIHALGAIGMYKEVIELLISMLR